LRKTTITLSSLALAALLTAPAWAGVHYKAKTDTEGQGRNGGMSVEVEGWASGENARVEFKDTESPILEAGNYMITKDAGKTMYMVDPDEKTYSKWDLQAMMGGVGGMLNSMGPMVKMEISEPKIEKLLEEDGGTLLGQPTRHYKYRTSYNMVMKIMGMGNSTKVVSEQDIWSTDKLQDLGIGAWLRSEPPTMGYEPLDKLIKAEMGKTRGFPLKTVTVTTSTSQKRGETTTTHQTMQVTQLDTGVTVPAARFEIPAGYKETEMALPGMQPGEGQEEQGGFGGLLRRKKKDGGN
jgi:hypothetical protein